MAGGRLDIAVRWPTADQVARALVTAAVTFGELDVLSRRTGPVLLGGMSGELHCQWAVLAALDVAYGQVALDRLARLVGLRYPAEGDDWNTRAFTTRLIRMKRQPWWRSDLEAELFKAVVL